MPLTTPRATTAATGGPQRLVLVGVLVLAAIIAAVVLASRDGPNPGPRVVSRSIIQGPQPKPAQVRLPDGRTLTCPRGGKPAVVIEGLDVRPPLAGGSHFLRGTYRVVVRASVVNEASRPIRVGAVRARIAGKPWQARVRAPDELSADAKAPVTVRGVFHSRSWRVASVSTDFTWRWRERGLRPCGAKGLIEDD